MPKERSHSETVTVDLFDGCQLVFTSHVSTGTDPDTRPGVRFEINFRDEQALRSFGTYFTVHDGPGHWGGGVIGRCDIAKLRDMFEIFLKSYARGAR